MKKFLNCNVLDVLHVYMKLNTEHYQTDFEYDKEIIRDAANSSDPLNKTLLWLSRPCGTECFLERKAYVEGTYAHYAWKFYDEQTNDNIIAFAIEIKGIKGEDVIGDLYQLDYHEHCNRIKKDAFPASTVDLEYADRKITIPYEPYFTGKMDYDGLKKYVILPADLKALESRLKVANAERQRDKYYTEWTLKGLLDSFTPAKAKSAQM